MSLDVDDPEVLRAGAARYVTDMYGPRCRSKDTDDFPELGEFSSGRCVCCEEWELFDQWSESLAQGPRS